MSQDDAQDAAQEQPAETGFLPPSVDVASIATGDSYTYHTPLPAVLEQDPNTACVLGVDEAGRGPVLGTCAQDTWFKKNIVY
jgi:ribonuclease H2 subunit A